MPFSSSRLETLGLLQYCRAPKNGQAGISRFFKIVPGKKFADKNGLDNHTQNVYKRCSLKRAALIADKNVNRLELRN